MVIEVTLPGMYSNENLAGWSALAMKLEKEGIPCGVEMSTQPLVMVFSENPKEYATGVAVFKGHLTKTYNIKADNTTFTWSNK
jgi:hypothetical protein